MSELGAPALLTPEGQEALAAAMAEADPASLGAATRLRARFSPELAAAATHQAALRTKARAKLGEQAATLYFTDDALQQATRPSVAAWRANRLASLGVRRVVDLGCGIGADSLAFLAAGLEVVAVEIDPTTAAYAQVNLGLATTVHVGDATELAPGLLADAGSETAVFIDPARRTDAGRTWRVSDFTPPWAFVGDLLAGPRVTNVKLGPGLPKELIPAGVESIWLSDRGDVVEASLWSGPGIEPGTAAVLLPGDHVLRRPGERTRLPVAPPAAYLIEPDGAVIRAGLLDAIAPDATWLLDPEIAYLSSDEPITSPFATTFAITETLPYNDKALRAWVRDNGIGTLEIKTRGTDVDPATLRRALRPKGRASATVIIARTPDGARALVANRI